MGMHCIETREIQPGKAGGHPDDVPAAALAAGHLQASVERPGRRLIDNEHSDIVATPGEGSRQQVHLVTNPAGLRRRRERSLQHGQSHIGSLKNRSSRRAALLRFHHRDPSTGRGGPFPHMNCGRPRLKKAVRQSKRVLRHLLAHSSVNRVVTAVVKPWARSLSPSILLRLPVTRVVRVRSAYCEVPVLLDTDGVDPIASMLYWKGCAGWEPETLPVFLRLINSGDTVLDVGANTGLFSLLAARRSSSVVVHAIEPVPRVFALLQANVARNHLTNILCHRLALSDCEGSLPMYVPQDAIPVMASLLSDWRPGSDSITVDTKTLDQFVADRGITDLGLIKVDTEGTENDVLAGAKTTLATYRPFVICEVLSAGNTAAALTDQLAAADYLFFLLTKNGPRATERVLGNAVGTCPNYLFVPRSRLREARLLLEI